MTTSDITYRVAADIGGTFTDLQILHESSGETWSFKASTTPDDPSRGLIDALDQAKRRLGFATSQLSFVIHGTTIATNAVIQNKLASGALITTSGFEDVLEIGRHARRDVYGLAPESRPLLVPRKHRFGLDERVAANGTITLPLNETSLAKIGNAIATAGIRTIAVCLLNAFANPRHEQFVRDWLARRYPDLAISISTELSPEIREFERTSTTVLNALLMPTVRDYLGRLRRRLDDDGIGSPLYVVQSNGGVSTPEKAATLPARLLVSGPCGGALAAHRLSQVLGAPNLVAGDMGGTSFDISVVHDGNLAVVTDGIVAGHPVRLPMVEIRTIGAGGGSIGWIDDSDRVRVGPQSAGAKPGPACYGTGGTEPTITDANVVLERIDGAAFLDGAMPLDRQLAHRAIATRLAGPLEMTVESAAEGMLAIATSNMAAAVRLSLFEKGLDPEDFAFVSFGGACGLHAADIAEELGIDTIILPRDPATLSAGGFLASDIAHDLAQTRLVTATTSELGPIRDIASALLLQGESMLDADGVAPANREWQFSADMRYRGQAYELLVPWGRNVPDEAMLRAAVSRFHELHQMRYAHAHPQDPVEVVTIRLRAIGQLPKPRGAPESKGDSPVSVGRRSVYVGGDWRDLPIYERDAIIAPVVGPAIIEEPFATHFVPPAWRLEPDLGGHLRLRKIGA